MISMIGAVPATARPQHSRGNELIAGPSLRGQITQIAEAAGATAVAVAFFDSRHKTEWGFHADRWFHAASTIKVPVLLGVFAAIEEGGLTEFSRVHVRNRFYSIVDHSPFRIDKSRDSTPEVHEAIGKTMQVRELARHMIVTSSNLATNLLLGVIGPESVNETLRELDLDDGLELRRGVEDELAFEHQINNRVTADGLLRVLVMLAEGKVFSPALSRRMMDILHGQEFNQGIPARLPKAARVAHKTGEISTIAHDAGVIYLPKRKPYALVILSEWDQATSGRSRTIAAISHLIYEFLVRGPRDE